MIHRILTPRARTRCARRVGFVCGVAVGFWFVLVPTCAPRAAHAQPAPPDAPLAPGRALVWGVVRDAHGEPLVDALVTVQGRTDLQALVDLDGRYRLELPPGRYNLQIFYEGFQPVRFEGVTVGAQQRARLDATLEPAASAEDVIAVETEAEHASLAGQLLARKRDPAAGDGVGRAEIAKTPDKNAAEAAKRVVGATVVGERFVYVRGLGERYTNALLDGAPLPSPEPDRQTVPLDLFPALMLDGLTIVKTFTPDVPGDCSGGSVRIATRGMPRAFTFSASLSLAANTTSSFRDGLGYRGSSTDFLGIDNGVRALPSSIPDFKVFRGATHPDGSYLTPEELTGHGRAINAYMSTERGVTPPNGSGSIAVGHAVDLGADGRIGGLAALSYARSFVARRGEVLRTYGLDPNSETGLRTLNDLTVERGIDQVRWGGLVSLAYQPTPAHELKLATLYSRSSDKEADEIEGFHEEKGALLHETRLSFVSRELVFGQLSGTHGIAAAGDAKLAWSLSLSRAGREEPDTRGTVYALDPAFGFAFEPDAQSGSHFYAHQKELSYGGKLDWQQPLVAGDAPTSVKLGALGDVRARDFAARRFRFRPLPGSDPAASVCATQSWDAGCPDALFTADHIGSLLELEENTRTSDAYEAGYAVFAGYAMVDVGILPNLRATIGERFEASRQHIRAFDAFDPAAAGIEGKVSGDDFLPAISLLWNATPNANLRLSLTRTVARPQLRELAPFAFTDYYGGREVQGNPDLKLTRVTNGDVRFEFFPSPSEVLAVSAFFKHFSHPIEEVIESAGARGIVTFQNADAARLFGLELEARKKLGFIHPALDVLSLVANLTWVESRVELDPSRAVFVTNRSRPLSNQAPYLVNAALDFEEPDWGTSARILYNVSGARIVQVGTQGMPDTYEQPRHALDVVVTQRVVEGLTVKVAGTNLALATVRRTAGAEAVVSSYDLGATFSLGATYTY